MKSQVPLLFLFAAVLFIVTVIISASSGDFGASEWLGLVAALLFIVAAVTSHQAKK